MYSLYLYFLGLSLRITSKALVIFKDQKRSHIAVWDWIQRFGSYHIYKRKRISAFVIDETLFELEIVIIGYGFVLNQFIVQCLEFIFQKKEICL
jgi:hypothetical protein